MTMGRFDTGWLQIAFLERGMELQHTGKLQQTEEHGLQCTGKQLSYTDVKQIRESLVEGAVFLMQEFQ